MFDPFCAIPVATLLEKLTEPAFIVDMAGRVLWVNTATERIFGRAGEDFIGLHLNQVLLSDSEQWQKGVLPVLDQKADSRQSLRGELVVESERRLSVEVTVSRLESLGEQCFLIFARETRSSRSVDGLHNPSAHDPLTGLVSRDELVAETEKALSEGRMFSVLFVVLTGTYRIGGLHGLEAAHHVLRTIANRLWETLEGHGLVSRIEGDLFAVLALVPDPEALAVRLKNAILRPISWGNGALHLEASVGISQKEDGLSSADDFFRAGFAAAKEGLSHHAHGGVILFTSDLGERLQYEALVESRLREVLATGGLSLALQAKVCARDGRILGAEALVRWDDPRLGRVPPSQFIPIAERVGIVSEITKWMLRQSLAEAGFWQQTGLDLSIAVNLSAVDLLRPDLVGDIGAAIASSGCDPSRLVLELTESAVAEDAEQAVKVLNELKMLGLTLSLDDFGTGYSSLSYLRRFPIDSIKIDQSFVAETPQNEDAVAIARTIVALARSLDMRTVAEGVETRAQAAFLRGLGVDELQGYLYSRPVSSAQFRALAMKGYILPED
jgi:PAS domain S-box-containing protein